MEENYDRFRSLLFNWYSHQSPKRITFKVFCGRKFAIVKVVSCINVNTYWKLFIDENGHIHRLVPYFDFDTILPAYDKDHCLKMHCNDLCVCIQTAPVQTQEYRLQPPQNLIQTTKTTVKRVALRFDNFGNLCFHSADLVTNHTTNEFDVKVNNDGCFYKECGQEEENLVNSFFKK